MSEHTGGTVTYHRAEYDPDRWYPWMVWFTDSVVYNFTAAEGEAMGLTVPEPAPLVVECNGHRIELSDEEADVVVDLWAEYADARDPNAELRCKTKLAGLLADARQDPQPTADTPSDDPTGWYITTGGPKFTKGQVLSGPYSTQADAFMARECVERFSKPLSYWVCPSTDAIGDAARGGASNG